MIDFIDEKFLDKSIFLLFFVKCLIAFKFFPQKPQVNNWGQYQQHQASAVGQQQQQYWNYNLQGKYQQQLTLKVERKVLVL